MHHHAQESLCLVSPLVFQALTANSANIYTVVRSGHGIETGCVDDDVQIVVLLGALDAGLGDVRDRLFIDIYKRDVVLVVSLKVARFQRHALDPEAVVFRNQFFGDLWVIHTLADPVCDVFGDFGVGFFFGKDFTEVL